MKKMNSRICFFLSIFLLFALFSCNRGIKIEVTNVESCCDLSLFRGVEPDIRYDDLCDIVGEPNEFIDMNLGGGEECHNPIYYFKEGKVMCYWSGGIKDEIGVVEFTPYNNTHIQIDSFFTCPLDSYRITPKTTKIRIYENDVLYFIIKLKEFRIVEISYM